MTIEHLMVGAIDMHVHCAPDPYNDTRVDALEIARHANEAGMKAVVIKTHHFCTATLAWMVNIVVNSPILVGSVALNTGVGGLNPDVVEAQVRAGAKVIWMPTASAAEHVSAFPDRKLSGPIGTGKDKNAGISIIDKDGKLVTPIWNILEIIKSNKLVLATGHTSAPEIFAIANEALRQHMNVIITHPFARNRVPSLTIEQAHDLVNMGAFIEFCFVACMPPNMRQSPEDMAGCIKEIGPGHCILSTDFGQAHNPPPTEGFRMMLANMLKFGLSEDALRTMVRDNPSKLLDLG